MAPKFSISKKKKKKKKKKKIFLKHKIFVVLFNFRKKKAFHLQILIFRTYPDAKSRQVLYDKQST